MFLDSSFRRKDEGLANSSEPGSEESSGKGLKMVEESSF